MAGRTQVTVRGNVGTDPAIRVNRNGSRVLTFRLASTPRVRDESGVWRDGRTDWFTVKVWSDWRDNVEECVFKGTPVVVTGTLAVETWTGEDGRDRTNATISADAVGVDLTHGIARYTKVMRERADGPGGPDDARAGAPGNGGLSAVPPWPPEGRDGLLDGPPEDDDPGEAFGEYGDGGEGLDADGAELPTPVGAS